MDFEVAPTYSWVFVSARPNDSGFDLFSIESKRVESGKQCIPQPGMAIRIPDDCHVRVVPCSGLEGVVDVSFRNSIKVILCNHGPTDHFIFKGDRIAQIIFERILMLEGVGASPHNASGL